MDAAENLLDIKRRAEGAESTRQFYTKLLKNNKKEALKLVNEENLSFPSLYILRNEFTEADIIVRLSPRNRIALEITREITNPDNELLLSEYTVLDYAYMVKTVLRWMIKTGTAEEDLGCDYEKILDIAAADLIKVFKDRSIFPLITDLMFRRHRKECFTYDLIWSFFEAKDPVILVHAAKYLKSSNPSDVEFAWKLLRFIPQIGKGDTLDGDRLFFSFTRWYEENSSFLKYTGQTMNQSCNPSPFAVNYEAKYLCKVVSPDTGMPIIGFSEEECRLLEVFNGLKYSIRIKLADDSFTIHRKDLYFWERWIRYPVAEQIRSIGAGGIE